MEICVQTTATETYFFGHAKKRGQEFHFICDEWGKLGGSKGLQLSGRHFSPCFGMCGIHFWGPPSLRRSLSFFVNRTLSEAHRGHWESVRELIQGNADPNKQNASVFTALHYAVKKCKPNVEKKTSLSL